MRRLFLPLVLLAILVAAVVLTQRADEDSDPGRATATSADPALVTPILSARRAPEWLRAPKSDSLLAEAVGIVLSSGTAPDDLCVLVQRDGEPIAANNTSAPIRGAELHRLITAAVVNAAGSGSGFRTEIAFSKDAEIRVDEEDQTAELIGDIWIIGGGDPVLSTESYISRFGDDRAFTDFDLLAGDAIAALQELNIVAVRGRVIGDETKYSPIERDYYNDKVTINEETFRVWNRNDGGENSVGPLAGLLLNDGFTSWPDELDQSQNRRASDPAVAVADSFDNMLEAVEISVSRSPRSGEAPPLAERQTLAVIDSPPLADIIRRSLVDATTAEMLLKEFGIRSGSSPERASAIFTLATTGFALADLPFDVGQAATIYSDGSGRSDTNRANCDILHAAISDPEGIGAAVLTDAAASPVAACSASNGELRVYVSANDTSTGVVGEFTAVNGERITFVMLADDQTRTESIDGAEPAGPYEFCNPLQAAMIDAIVGHPYGPKLDDLAPLAE